MIKISEEEREVELLLTIKQIGEEFFSDLDNEEDDEKCLKLCDGVIEKLQHLKNKKWIKKNPIFIGRVKEMIVGMIILRKQTEEELKE